MVEYRSKFLVSNLSDNKMNERKLAPNNKDNAPNSYIINMFKIIYNSF